MLRKIHRKALDGREAEDGVNPTPREYAQASQQEVREARALRRVEPGDPTPPRPPPARTLNTSGRIEWEDFDPFMMELR
ncbi:hypothetical protein TWF730_010631 [Orbilia blumenaviensis]|uniref:Uncharacterized protein n=1 Tax=Orbilia blumenaviensis TaxID=1796055 RepID=A0AAV9UNU0_9PEZI